MSSCRLSQGQWGETWRPKKGHALKDAAEMDQKECFSTSSDVVEAPKCSAWAAESAMPPLFDVDVFADSFPRAIEATRSHVSLHAARRSHCGSGEVV